MEKTETNRKAFDKIRVDPSCKPDTACLCVGVEFNSSARFQNVGKHIVNPHGNMQARLHGASNRNIEPEKATASKGAKCKEFEELSILTTF